MTFIPCPNCVDIGLEMTLALKPVSCVLGASCSGSITVTNMTQLAQTLIDGIWTFMSGTPKIIATSNLVLHEIKVTDLTSSSSPVVLVTNGTISDDLPFTGNNNTPELTSQDCSVVTWQTIARGRSYRGRSFWPGLPQDHLLNANTLTAAAVTELTGWWSMIHTTINGAIGGTFTHAVISRHSGGVPRLAGISTPISAFRVNTYIGSQNKRR